MNTFVKLSNYINSLESDREVIEVEDYFQKNDPSPSSLFPQSKTKWKDKFNVWRCKERGAGDENTISGLLGYQLVKYLAVGDWNWAGFQLKRFTHLTHLFLELCELNHLPDLPKSLQVLNVSYNNLKKIPELPTQLQVLRCGNNKLKNIPELPQMLMHLSCNDNFLKDLPTMHPPLQYLDCDNNYIKKMEFTRHARLQYLYCAHNNIEQIVHLPENLTVFDCRDNKLRALPTTLPYEMKILYCGKNQLTYMPYLPIYLIELECSKIQVNILPELPESLEMLRCDSSLYEPYIPDYEDLANSNGALRELKMALPKIHRFRFVYYLLRFRYRFYSWYWKIIWRRILNMADREEHKRILI